MFKGLLSKLFPSSGGGVGVADKLGGLVDRFVHTKDEKAAFEKEMSAILFDAQDREQSHTTERWKTDMTSDSWLSKNIRPMVLIFLLLALTTLIVLDSSGTIGFVVAAHWVGLIEILCITVFGAYFGDRAVRGFQSIKNKGK